MDAVLEIRIRQREVKAWQLCKHPRHTLFTGSLMGDFAPFYYGGTVNHGGQNMVVAI